MAVLTASIAPERPDARTFSSWRRVMFGCVIALALAVLAVVQLRDVALGGVFAHLDIGWLVAAALATVASLAAAAHNLSAFAPVRLRAVDTMRAQLAVCGLRVIAPSAVSTPAIGARYLTRSGLCLSEALTVVATAQAAQLLTTLAVVALIAAAGSTGLDVPNPTIAIALIAAAAVLVIVGVVVGRRVAAVRRTLAGAVSALRALATHLRRRPQRVVTGLSASAALTITHVAAFACCVHAVGGHVPVLALTAIYLGAASAGSLVPTPAGLGAVEAAMIAGLCAAGEASATATATGAALITRLVMVWAPAIPGWLALRSMRRRGLL